MSTICVPNTPIMYTSCVQMSYRANLEKNMLEFGNRIKTLRIKKSITQEQLAERLGVTKSTISGYELGTRYPSIDMLIKLAQSFNVSTDFLLGVDKIQSLDVKKLTTKQLMILNDLILEFTENT